MGRRQQILAVSLFPRLSPGTTLVPASPSGPSGTERLRRNQVSSAPLVPSAPYPQTQFPSTPVLAFTGSFPTPGRVWLLKNLLQWKPHPIAFATCAIITSRSHVWLPLRQLLSCPSPQPELPELI